MLFTLHAPMFCSGWRDWLHWPLNVSLISIFTRAVGGYSRLLFLVPDVSLLGYLRSAGKSSAAFYNVVHSDVLPLAMGLIAWTRGPSLAGQLALIWLSHISFDRCLGFGLKFTGDFRSTHIQSAAASRPPCVQQ